MRLISSCQILQEQFIFLILIISLASVDFVECKRSLKQLHILFRHGERTPSSFYTNDPYKNYNWSAAGGFGQLTNDGKLTMYTLGQKLRDTYKDFLPDYYLNEDVKVTSSYADRCLMSAQCLLAGLYPPKGEQIWNENLLWQPIPVSYLPRNEDNLIAMKRACKKYDEEFQRILGSDEIRRYTNLNKDLFDYVSQHTGDQINTIAKAEELYMTLESEIAQNLTLPSWINQDVLMRLKRIAARYQAAFTETDYMKRVKGGVFLNKTIDLMKNDNRTLLHLYSGHDIYLVHILRTLNITNLIKPGFGAHLVLELYNDNLVQVFYRNDAQTGEKYRTTLCKSGCPLQEFENFFKAVLSIDWNNECLNEY